MMMADLATRTLSTDATIERLNRHLADALLLAAEAKAWHWSVYGPTFAELHAFFEAQADVPESGVSPACSHPPIPHEPGGQGWPPGSSLLGLGTAAELPSTARRQGTQPASPSLKVRP
jgi:hypothetical protein